MPAPTYKEVKAKVLTFADNIRNNSSHSSEDKARAFRLNVEHYLYSVWGIGAYLGLINDKVGDAIYLDIIEDEHAMASHLSAHVHFHIEEAFKSFQ